MSFRKQNITNKRLANLVPRFFFLLYISEAAVRYEKKIRGAKKKIAESYCSEVTFTRIKKLDKKIKLVGIKKHVSSLPTVLKKDLTHEPI